MMATWHFSSLTWSEHYVGLQGPYLHEFEVPWWVVDQAFQVDLVVHRSLQLHVSATVQL